MKNEEVILSMAEEAKVMRVDSDLKLLSNEY
jgi:hypothetical protein